MPQGHIAESLAQTAAHFLEKRYLSAGEIVVDIFVSGCKVRIHRLDVHIGLALHELYHAVQLLLHESQTVHSGVEGNVDGIIAAA